MNTITRNPIVGALLATLLFAGSLHAQKKPEFKWKIYVGEHEGEKRVYVHDSLPVYFFMSSENDPNNAVRLESKSKYANPMEFDGHGRHYLRHKDKEYEHEVLFEVWADGIAPNTTLDHSKIVTYQKDNKTLVQKGATINLVPKDEMSGIQRTLHSLDKTEFVAAKTITLSQEKEYFYQYFSVDNVGNIEKTRTITYQVDGTTPISKHEIVGDQAGNILSARSKIKLSTEDQGAGVKKTVYKIDDGKERSYTSSISMYSLSEGEHTLTYYGIDNVENKESPKTFKFFVDKTAPVVTDEVIGDKYVANGKEYVSGRSKYSLKATDNKAGVKEIQYSFNGKSYETYSQPFKFDENLSNVYIKANATDKVNNKSKSVNPSKYVRYVDTKAPVLSHSFDGPTFTTRDTTFINSTTKINLKAVDYSSGVQKIEYAVSGKGKTEYKEAFTVSNEGNQSVNYSALDNVNNASNNSFFFIVDNTPPEIYTRFSIEPIGNITLGDKTTSVYSDHTGLFLSATDKMVGFDKIFYKINGGTEKLYTEMIKGFQKGKTYTVELRSVDKLGNESKTSVEFSIFNEEDVASVDD